MKQVYAFISLLMAASGCGSHTYPINHKELKDYAANAKEVFSDQFILLSSGDTLLCSNLKINRMKGSITCDSRIVSFSEVKAFQDKEKYVLDSCTRILRGDINLYMYYEDNTSSHLYYDRSASGTFDPSNSVWKTKTTGTAKTLFLLGSGSEKRLVTYDLLIERMKNCQRTLELIESEFGSTVWPKHKSENINDYRALIRIINSYNAGDCR